MVVLDLGAKAVAARVATGNRPKHALVSPDGRFGYVSNEKDGNIYKLDMANLKLVGEITTGGAPGGGQPLNVWTNVFEELPRQ